MSTMAIFFAATCFVTGYATGQTDAYVMAHVYLAAYLVISSARPA